MTIIQYVLFLIGVFVMVGNIYRQHKRKRERHERYRHAYVDFIRNAFPGNDTLSKQFYSALDDYNDDCVATGLKKLSDLRDQCRTIDEEYAVTVFSALCLNDMGEYEEAIACYCDAQNIYQNSVVASNIGLCYERIGVPSAAEEWYLQSVALEPVLPLPYINLSFLAFRFGDFKTGMEYSQRALTISPSHPKVLKAAALCSYMLEDMEAYKKYYKQAVANGVDGKELTKYYIENVTEDITNK